MRNKYSLTFPQQNIWLVNNLYNSSRTNLITGIININKNFNVDFCKETVNNIIKNNDALRIKILLDGEIPYQCVREYQYVDINVIDMQNLNKNEIEKYIYEYKKEYIDILGDKLFEFQILKYSEEKGAVLLKMHHIVSDAWSYAKIIEQFVKYYTSLENSQIIDEINVPSYIEFVNTTLEYKNSEKYIKDEEFWREYLNGFQDKVTLKDRIKKINNTSSRYNIKLDKDINDKILEYCKENRISPYVMFLAALSTYMYRIKDKNDFVIGTPSLNRANFKEKQMLGMFVSTLPLRVQISENEKFLDVARNIARNTMSIFRHQKYPYINTLKNVRVQNNTNNNLYGIILSYQNAKAEFEDKEKYDTKWYENDFQNEDLQIHILDMDSTGILEINYDYLNELFDDIEIEYLHTRLMAIIENAILDKDIDVENIEIMSKEEKHKILYEFNDTKTDYPKDKSVIELFEEQVEKTPDNIALVFEDKKLTYKELNEKANSVANYLIENGVKFQENIAIELDKSIEYIISVLGVLKVEACYVPIDTKWPKERRDLIKNISGIRCIINKDIFEYINFEKKTYFKVKSCFSFKDNVYIMFTSGTTGTPKGVMVNNRNIIRLVKNTNYIKFYESDKIIQTGSIAFDAITFECWGALLNGITLYLIDNNILLDPIKLEENLLKNKITIMWLTSSLFNHMSEFNPNMFRNLRVLLVGGDVLSPKYINKVINKCPNLEIINGYGPTENTTFSTFFKIDKEYEINIPIGKPISNSFCYVISKKRRLLPMFVEGELLVSGDGISNGYLNLKDVTKNKFISNLNFINNTSYLTGDIVKWDIQGNLSFVGRRDNQYKIRGYRIELDEIRNILLAIQEIKDCYITVSNSKKDLILIYEATNSINESGLKNIIKEKLPYYMIPKYIKRVDKMPINSNGKLNIQNLKEFILKEYKEKEEINLNEYNGIYYKIYKVFCDALKKEKININDNFFEIGGDSLSAIDVIIKLISYDITATYSDLYKNPSIKELGDYLLQKSEKKSISANIEKFDYTRINKVLSNNRVNSQIKIDDDIGNVLLLGATGFLGMHIIEEYINNCSGNVYCLVRDKNGRKGYDRFIERLNFYFEKKYNKLINKRIFVVEGDVTKKEIIISKNFDKYNSLINTVINCSAIVKHFGDFKKFFDLNVYSTQNIIEYCIKYNKKLIHVSTLSVSGNILETGHVEQNAILKGKTFKEEDIYIGQDLDNIYAYTKFLGERFVLESIYTQNLNAKIMRVGNLTSRSYDGKFQFNYNENAFANRLKTMIELGVLPENFLDFYLEFTPVNYAAKAILLLSKVEKKYNVFHVFNHNHVKIKEVDEYFNKMNINLKHITKNEMRNIIKESSKNKKRTKLLKGIILDINTNSELEYKPQIIVKSDFTTYVLQKLEFTWPIIDFNYVKKYIKCLYDESSFEKEGGK